MQRLFTILLLGICYAANAQNYAPGVNPLATCWLIKTERWITFWGYASDTTKTIVPGQNNIFTAYYNDDRSGKVSNSSGLPGQPTEFKPGTFLWKYKVATPYFLNPRGDSTGGRPYKEVEWNLDGKSLKLAYSENLYSCPTRARADISLSGITNPNNTATTLKESVVTFLQGRLPNVTNDRIVVSYVAEDVNDTSLYTFTIEATPSGYVGPNEEELAKIWARYANNQWPPEVEPPAAWELIFELLKEDSILEDLASGNGVVVTPVADVPDFANQSPKDPSVTPPGPLNPNVPNPNAGSALLVSTLLGISAIFFMFI